MIYSFDCGLLWLLRCEAEIVAVAAGKAIIVVSQLQNDALLIVERQDDIPRKHWNTVLAPT
ncbi:hypothetical protein AS026_12220 [Rhizobium altiplani]|uniref:Uncharacterized protein n=1 Tax=Rhizobium altiplani TaxID=1864509 RepID=A0A109JFN2_9HYPH|nr:hypothetical protein AS026_20180 [Rhizobium altiplani]KWV43310.1 hypothetical protein AS026_20030 [Rhizobium altiplani]KWV43426.1 hypothetical protein AS026_19680 [Rhizobium altiplani]KWV48071.1 hypothetical protein AS026_12220 [Rhizobium altiplani]